MYDDIVANNKICDEAIADIVANDNLKLSIRCVYFFLFFLLFRV